MNVKADAGRAILCAYMRRREFISERSAAKAAFAGLIGTDSSQEVDLAKGRP